MGKFVKAQDVRERLTEEDYLSILDAVGAEPRKRGNVVECLTVCHGGDSHKLILFPDTGQFYCHTSCGKVGDVFSLLIAAGVADTVPQAVLWVIDHLDMVVPTSVETRRQMQRPPHFDLCDLDVPRLPALEGDPIGHYPLCRNLGWENEGIATWAMDDAGIRYDPVDMGILIPQRDIDGRLVGIKERMFDAFSCGVQTYDTKADGKYRMWRGYRFPVGDNLYGIDKAKDAIAMRGFAIVFEGEKSCLKLRSYRNDSCVPCVATGGCHVTPWQMRILKACGARRILFAFDKDYTFKRDAPRDTKEYNKLLNAYKTIARRYSNDFECEFVIDRGEELGLHDSPADRGIDTLKSLYRKRLGADEVMRLRELILLK